MDEHTKLLIEIKTDIGYIKQMVASNRSENKELREEVEANKLLLVDHLSKVKGFSILLGVASSVWAFVSLVQT